MNKLNTIMLLVSLFLAFHISSIFLSLTGSTPVVITSVSGGSMYPHLRDLDLVVAVRVRNGSEVKPGGLYAYRDESGKIILHRVIRVVNNTALFMGDNNCIPDGYIPLDRVLYRVVFIIPRYITIPFFLASYTVLSYVSVFRLRGRRERFATELSIVISLLVVIATSLSVTVVARRDVVVKPLSVPSIVSVRCFANYTVIVVRNAENYGVKCFSSSGAVPCSFVERNVIRVDSVRESIVLLFSTGEIVVKIPVIATCGGR